MSWHMWLFYILQCREKIITRIVHISTIVNTGEQFLLFYENNIKLYLWAVTCHYEVAQMSFLQWSTNYTKRKNYWFLAKWDWLVRFKWDETWKKILKTFYSVSWKHGVALGFSSIYKGTYILRYSSYFSLLICF